MNIYLSVQHKNLVDNKCVSSVRVTEFKLTPHDGCDVPYIVDGEPMASGSVHVKILQRQLRLFGVAHDRLLQTLNVSVKTSTVTLSPGSLLSSTLSSSSTMNLDEAIPPKEVTLHFAVLWS